MLRILALTHRLPFPPDRGDRIRSYQVIRHLAGRHEVALAAVSQGPADPAHVRALDAMCKSVDVGVVSPVRRRLSAVAHLATATPLTVPLFWSPALMAQIDERLRRERFDVVLAYCSSMAPYVLDRPDVPLVVDLVDADSEKWQDYARLAAFPLRLVYRREAWLLRRVERRLASRAAHVLVASEREAVAVRSIAPAAAVTTVPNGVTIPEGDAPRSPRPLLLFTGVMDYWPNEDAAVSLAVEILPRVRRTVPDAELHLVGQRPTARVRRLARRAGVVVTGWVPDLLPHLREAAVFVAPLRVARGIQNKVLEAMAAGVPVVCSPEAAGGLTAVLGRDLVVADGPDATAASVTALLSDPDRRDRLAAAGLAFVSARHRWDASLDAMEHILIKVAAAAVRPLGTAAVPR